jgi:hypothetical protein
MSNAIELSPDKRGEIISKLVLKGDLSGLTEVQQVQYYNMFCESLGLNPVTKPFEILKLQGKQVLYAKKDATEQLRKINGVSITSLTSEIQREIIIVIVKGRDKTGRTDASTGAVAIANLKGDSLANAVMKAETKAKRRLTLSICGLGILDETEIETIPGTMETQTAFASLPEEKKEKVLEKDSVERREIEKEIGGLALGIGPEAVEKARDALRMIHDMEKSKAITFEASVERVKVLRDGLKERQEPR